MAVRAPRRQNVPAPTFKRSGTGFFFSTNGVNERGPEGLIDGQSTGSPPKLNARQKGALARVVEEGPKSSIEGVVRWRLTDLAAWLHENFEISLDTSTVSRRLRDMGDRTLTAKPHQCAQNPEAVTAFKTTFPPEWRTSKTGWNLARP